MKLNNRIIIIILLLSIIFITNSCFENKKLDKVGISIITNALMNAMGMQFKNLEVNKANIIFDKYKKLKVDIIRKNLLGENYSIDKIELVKLRNNFNDMTLDETTLYYVNRGERENQYIEEFENNIIKSIIENWKQDLKFDLSILRIIYED